MRRSIAIHLLGINISAGSRTIDNWQVENL